MVRFTLHRFMSPRRSVSYSASCPTHAYEQRPFTTSNFFRHRLPRFVHALAILFAVFSLATVVVLNLSPSYARLFGAGKILSWRLHHTPTTSPSHAQRSEYMYTLYPAGICVQIISTGRSAFALSASDEVMHSLLPRAIDPISPKAYSATPCLVPVSFKSSWIYRIPHPYGIDIYSPTDAILKQRPYGLVGSVDTYPAFLCYFFAIVFAIAPVVSLIRWWKRTPHLMEVYAKIAEKEDDVEHYYDDASTSRRARAASSPTASRHYPSKFGHMLEPEIHYYTILFALLSMTCQILASVNVTLTRDSLLQRLEQGAPDVDGVWKEDIGLAVTWTATACMILVGMSMLLRALIIGAIWKGWIPRRFLQFF